MKFKNKLALTMCVVFSLTACSPKKSSEEYIQSAEAHIASGKNSSAILDLKNAISIDLKNPTSRLLLGTLYLDVGDAKAAEKELNQSLELNGNKELILPKLFKALNLQHKSEDIIELTNQTQVMPAAILPEILIYQALAYIKLGDKDKAKDAIAEANETSSQSAYSQLGNAYLMADATNINGALSLLGDILLNTPELIEALMLKGQLLFSQGDYKHAIEAFNEYHLLLPNNIQIRLFLANSYIKNEQYTKADEHLDTLLKIVPEHPFTNQLKGLVFYQNGDYENALAHTNKAIQNGLNVPSNKVVAGLSSFQLAQYEQAHHFLLGITDVLPPSHPVKKVFALTQLHLGYSTEAANMLDELEGLSAGDVSLFTAASFESLKTGNITQAKSLLEKTNELTLENPSDIVKIGILKLSMNDIEGIADLEKAMDINPELPMAKMALAAAYLKNNNFDKAAALAKKWKAEHPNQVEGYNLAAKVYLMQEKQTEAEIELSRAIEINQYNPYSLLYFSEKAIKQKAPDKAISLLSTLFEAQPNHIKGLILNYKAHRLINKQVVAVNKIEKSFNASQESPMYRMLYARVLFIQKAYERVIDLLKNAENNGGFSATHWVLLGDSYLHLDRNKEALTSYEQWLKSEPMNKTAYLRIISTYEKMKNYVGALSTIEYVLLKAPLDEQFNILFVHYHVLNGTFIKAQNQLNKLTIEQSRYPLVKSLQGKIWFKLGEFEKALPSLKETYNQSQTQENAMVVFVTLKHINREEEGFEFLQKHVSSKPSDSISRSILAEVAISFDIDEAKTQYGILLDSEPNNFTYINNLAWLEFQTSNFRVADELIMRALEIETDNSNVLDTAGLIKLKLGERDQAIKLLKKAKMLAPKSTEIAKHYRDAMNSL